MCIPDVDNLREEILNEVHFVAYSVHPGVTKMHHSIRDLYWWDGLKKDVADYVSKCLTCQRVKAEHQKPFESFNLFRSLSGNGRESLYTL